MSEPLTKSGKSREKTLQDIAKITLLLNSGLESEVVKIVRLALEDYSHEPAIVRGILSRIYAAWWGCDLTALCACVISCHQALDVEKAKLDPHFLAALGSRETIMGQWRAAAFAFQNTIQQRKSFLLSDFFQLARTLYCDQELSEASRLITGALDVVATMAAQAKANSGGRVRILLPYGHSAITRSIGEMCQTFSIFLMASRLGWLDSQDSVFVIHGRERICNPTMFGYWESQVPVLDIRSNMGDSFILKEGLNSLWCLKVPDRGGLHRDAAWPMLLEAWHDRALPPMLQLKPSDRERGDALLANLGFSKDDWFVGLHVREDGWSREDNNGVNSYRSARIEDYLPMIKAITAQGGWVIRLGDGTMTPLPSMNRVIDYATSSIKSDWMDVYLCASARFVVGTQSGLHFLAKAFGVPLVVTNYLPVIAFPAGPQDLCLHQRIFSREMGRELTIKEAFSPPFVHQFSRYFFDNQDLSVIRNAPEELTDAAIQMIEQLNGAETYSADDEQLWQRHQEQSNFSGYRFRYRIGRLFLRNIRALLE